MAAANSNIYQFKVTLKGVKPKIWRRIQVPATFTFYKLHLVVLNAMGWGDAHLHQFIFKDQSTGARIYIGDPDMNDDGGFASAMGLPKTIPEKTTGITEYFSEAKNKAIYEYDFGDGWEHEVVLEKILAPEANIEYPRCIAGKRACPPCCCGGTHGYAELLEILADPEHEEHKDRKEWMEMQGYGDDTTIFDPEKFDMDSLDLEYDMKAFMGGLFL